MTNLIIKNKIPTSEEVKHLYPLTEEMQKVKENNDSTIKDIILNKSDKILLLVGPCSVDNEEALRKYLTFLKLLQEKVKDKIFICPRIFTTKPRSNGCGYKGVLHRPDIKNDSNLVEGIKLMRKLHYLALKDFGFSSSDEMLYPDNYPYLDDLLSYVVIGARSSEDQIHRLVASSLDVPVGMKNPTSGNLVVLMNSLHACSTSHSFIYNGYEVTSKGNPFYQGILRGYEDLDGKMHENYHYEDLIKVDQMFKENHLEPRIIVDANHANSNKNYLNESQVVLDVIESMKKNNEIKKMVRGFMIESYLEDGSQKENESIFGKSYTDGCLGKEKTEQLIMKIYELLK